MEKKNNSNYPLIETPYNASSYDDKPIVESEWIIVGTNQLFGQPKGKSQSWAK